MAYQMNGHVYTIPYKIRSKSKIKLWSQFYYFHK